MNFSINEYDDIVELATEGNILHEDVDALRSICYELIDKGKLRIVLNMAKSNYISSLCLALIVDVKNRLARLNGDIKIANVNKLIRNLLEITNLEKKIEVFDDIESAVSSFDKDVCV